jgi:hypothetical protein
MEKKRVSKGKHSFFHACEHVVLPLAEVLVRWRCAGLAEGGDAGAFGPMCCMAGRRIQAAQAMSLTGLSMNFEDGPSDLIG